MAAAICSSSISTSSSTHFWMMSNVNCPTFLTLMPSAMDDFPSTWVMQPFMTAS
jgi:hypothetical protein